MASEQSRWADDQRRSAEAGARGVACQDSGSAMRERAAGIVSWKSAWVSRAYTLALQAAEPSTRVRRPRQALIKESSSNLPKDNWRSPG
jgi:hypothetical protein